MTYPSIYSTKPDIPGSSPQERAVYLRLEPAEQDTWGSIPGMYAVGCASYAERAKRWKIDTWTVISVIRGYTFLRV